MLYLIGLGLGDERDITLKGLDAIKQCSSVFLEHYTAILPDCELSKLENLYNCKIKLADRNFVESQSDLILSSAKDSNVALLVVGDPFAATTHSDLLLRANQLNINVKVIHNASIMNAVGITGLQLYNFGQTISIPFINPDLSENCYSFIDKLKINYETNLHTLCLLDIKVKEQSFENLAAGKLIFEPPRYMTINQAIRQLFQIRQSDYCYNESTKAFGLARLGQDEQKIVSGTLAELEKIDFGGPLHSLVICAPNLHFIEMEMFEFWHWDKTNRESQIQKEREQKVLEYESELNKRLEEQRLEYEKRMQQTAALKAEKERLRLEEIKMMKNRFKQEIDDEETIDMSPLL